MGTLNPKPEILLNRYLIHSDGHTFPISDAGVGITKVHCLCSARLYKPRSLDPSSLGNRTFHGKKLSG